MSGRINVSLLRAAREEFVGRILPALAGEDRYTGAMLRRALDVLLAEANAETPPEAALSAFGDARSLAHGLRQRNWHDSAELRAALTAYVEAKLQISNPRFLVESRQSAKGPSA